VKVEKIAGTLHKLAFAMSDLADAMTVNMVASIGTDGILLVDVGWEQTSEKVRAKLREMDDGPVKLIVITHPHLDHHGGKGIFKEQATLIAHKNARNDLNGNYFALGPLPGQDMAIIDVGDDLSLRFNGEDIRIIHTPGHTHSDMIVWFESSGVVCLGDLILADRYPPLDLARGGDAVEYAGCLAKLIDQLPADARLITGHGRDYSMDDLKEHHRMTVATIELIRKGIAEGKDAPTMVEQAILKDWAKWDSPEVSSELWITQAFQCLSGQSRGSVSEPLTKTIVEKGIDAALEQYRKLKASQPKEFNFGEGELNMLGYHLLWRDMPEAAVEVFKLNVEVYPESVNPYDSLGEGYVAIGNKELAIESYEKALALNPEYPSSIAALEGLRGDGEG
jgi:glyoxylase-like metal-dependent hydrolase (beta-lactamase superfamily II)